MKLFPTQIEVSAEPSRFAPFTPCWNWVGHKWPNGYGRVLWHERYWPAHRLSWLLSHSRPSNLYVCHKCDNILCVNPDHLFLGTASENQLDRIKWSASLTEGEIKTIRESEMSDGFLAKRYKIQVNQVAFIRG